MLYLCDGQEIGFYGIWSIITVIFFGPKIYHIHTVLEEDLIGKLYSFFHPFQKWCHEIFQVFHLTLTYLITKKKLLPLLQYFAIFTVNSFFIRDLSIPHKRGYHYWLWLPLQTSLLDQYHLTYVYLLPIYGGCIVWRENYEENVSQHKFKLHIYGD